MRSVRRIMMGVVAVACLALTAPVAAQADTRFASPTGANGAACTEQDPCSFLTALTLSLPAAEIVLLPGDYAVGVPFLLNGG